MTITLRPMEIRDYDPVYALWSRTPGMGMVSADSREGIGLLLGRNPGLSVLAEAEAGSVVGAALVTHDGRRGFIYHLAVAEGFRGQGIGRRLVRWSLDRLTECGMTRCNLVVYVSNEEGRRFWRHIGFRERTDVMMFSCDL